MKRLVAILVMPVLAAAITVVALRAHAAEPRLPGTRIADPIDYLVRHATIGAPRAYQDLTIYPVITRPMPGFGQVVGLDEAMRRGWLRISEYGGGSVNEVMAQNLSDRHIFMMASEMIGAAKQDRIIRDDALLAPHSKARIPVYCVEQHRWHGVSDEFRPLGANVSPVLRSRAMATPSQGEVWAGVAKQQEDLGVKSPTGSASVVYEAGEVQRQVAPYRDKFIGVPDVDPRASGVVVLTRGSITVADVFCEPALFRALWPRLLDSYIVDALAPVPQFAHGIMPPRPDVQAFLQRALQARRLSRPTPGGGEAYDLRGGGIMGTALVAGQAVVHLELFPAAQPVPLRTPGVDWRRQRLEEAH
jgi:hypothetical protein